MLVSIYGAEAGNLALKVLSVGGFTWAAESLHGSWKS